MRCIFKFNIKINQFDCVLGALRVSLHRFRGTFYAKLKPKCSTFLKMAEQLIRTTSRDHL
jgi:hypothetical protein